MPQTLVFGSPNMDVRTPELEGWDDRIAQVPADKPDILDNV